MIVDERRRLRQDGALDAVTAHPLHLLGHVEEGRVQPEMHAANVEIDQIAFGPLDLDGKFIARFGEGEEFFRNEVAVDVGDHRQSPKYAVFSRSSFSSAWPRPSMTMRPFSST